MDRVSLVELLDDEGVGLDAYRLDGREQDDSLVLEHRSARWAVVYWERGSRTLQARFDTEDEACRYLADRLLADTSNRFQVVTGPKPPREADALFAKWLASHHLTREDFADDEIRVDTFPWTSGDPRRRYWVRRTALRRIH